jgi:hypothetical protein
MKALPWICGLSLAANLGLAAYHFSTARPAPARATSLSAAPADTTPAKLPPLADPASAFVRADTPLAKILDGTDLRAMRDALEASGLTADDAKAILRARIRQSQKSARDAIDRRRSPAEETWWYQDEETRQKFEEKRRADRRALDDQLNQTLAGLFGEDPNPAAEPRIHNQARFLPESKRLAVSRILEDYEAMQRDARPRNYHGASLPSDEEKRRFIEEERRRDLAEVLTPEELRAFDQRHSPTAQNLRWQLGAMKPTEQEYQLIFDARRTLDTQFDNRGGGDRPPDFWQKRQEAEAALMNDLRAKLGEERFIDYALSNDHSARQVTLAAERYGLAPDVGRQLWRLRQEAGQAGKAIYDDQSLSLEQKRARLAELAARSRDAVNRALGPEAQSELKNNQLVQWVGGLERNHIQVFNATGNSSSGYGL